MSNETAPAVVKSTKAVKAAKPAKEAKPEVVIAVSIITAKPVAGSAVESLDFTAKSESAALRSAAIKLGVVAPEDAADEYPYALRNKIAEKFKTENKFGGVFITVDGSVKNLLG